MISWKIWTKEVIKQGKPAKNELAYKTYVREYVYLSS